MGTSGQQTWDKALEKASQPRPARPRLPRKGHIIMSLLIMLAIALIIVALFLNMYHSARQNVTNVWENKVIQLAKSTEYYLARPTDAIELCAIHVEDMIDGGATNAEINDYLIREMDSYVSLVDDNYTGVYGYVRGEYLDASGWVPTDDFVPSERPWYTQAIRAKGDVCLVSPYENMQTHETMISVAKLLSDHESVLSIDIDIAALQYSIDDISRENGVKCAFIVDGEGAVVVHTNHTEVGANYLTGSGDYGRTLVQRARRIARSPSYCEVDKRREEVIFAEKVSDSWTCVMVVDEDILLGSISHLNIILLLFLALALYIWYSVSRNVTRKYEEADQLAREVMAVADIYESMTLIDLKTGDMTLMRSNAGLDELLGGDLTNYGERFAGFAATMASEGSRDMLAQFLDPSTFETRFQDARSVSFDYLNRHDHWFRIQLIVVDRDEDGSLRHIILAVESIDAERRQQEGLRRLAETDPLSNLNNRRSGEAHIRELMEGGERGMFFLVDVDDFKTINDRYGHAAGDLVITAVADCMKRTFREGDVTYRLGGDEFAAYAWGLSCKGDGDMLARRLHSEVADIDLPETRGAKVTVSVGTSCFTGDAQDSFEALYQRADESMYAVKRERRVGRDRA